MRFRIQDLEAQRLVETKSINRLRNRETFAEKEVAFDKAKEESLKSEFEMLEGNRLEQILAKL